IQTLLATNNIRQIHHHLTFKTARTQQSWVQHIRTVGSSNHNHAFATFKTIHFYHHLVQSLLTLIVSATQASAPMTSHCVDFVDKNDTGRLLLGLLKHIPHTGSTHPDKHLHKVRTRNGEEGNLGLASDSFSEQGFTGTGRADH